MDETIMGEVSHPNRGKATLQETEFASQMPYSDPLNFEDWASLDMSPLHDPMLYSIEKLSNDFNLPDVFGQPFFFGVQDTSGT